MRIYQRPETDLVLLTASTVMQGIIEASEEEGPNVFPDDPVNPGPGGELSNHNSLWDVDEEGF